MNIPLFFSMNENPSAQKRTRLLSNYIEFLEITKKLCEAGIIKDLVNCFRIRLSCAYLDNILSSDIFRAFLCPVVVIENHHLLWSVQTNLTWVLNPLMKLKFWLHVDNE